MVEIKIDPHQERELRSLYKEIAREALDIGERIEEKEYLHAAEIVRDKISHYLSIYGHNRRHSVFKEMLHIAAPNGLLCNHFRLFVSETKKMLADKQNGEKFFEARREEFLKAYSEFFVLSMKEQAGIIEPEDTKRLLTLRSAYAEYSDPKTDYQEYIDSIAEYKEWADESGFGYLINGGFSTVSERISGNYPFNQTLEAHEIPGGLFLTLSSYHPDNNLLVDVNTLTLQGLTRKHFMGYCYGINDWPVINTEYDADKNDLRELRIQRIVRADETRFCLLCFTRMTETRLFGRLSSVEGLDYETLLEESKAAYHAPKVKRLFFARSVI